MEDSVTKKARVVMERSSNGEVHLIFLESRFNETGKNAEYFDEAEIKKIMKEEAVKPLLLLREEGKHLTSGSISYV